MHPFRTASRSFVRFRAALPFLVALIAMGGCVDGVDGPDGGTTGSIALSVSNAKAPIAVGMPAVSAVTITRTGGYTGTVILSADSLPTGVTVSFDPAALAGVATTSIMTITAATTAAVAIDTINVRASGTNVTTSSATVEVSVALGSITLASPATSVVVPQGTAGSVPLTITRVNGFAAGVSLVAEGLPANVTATFTPALLPNGSVSSSLVLAATSAATPGTSTITVRARAQGIADKTTAVQLTVASSTVSEFALSASPASFSVVAGSPSQSIISIGRTGGFSGNVTFALTGLPAGMTGTFTPNPASANTTTLSFTTTTAVAPGTYTLQVTATAAGLPAHTLPMLVTVTPIPGVKVSVAPTTITIVPGGFAQAAVLLTRVAGFTGDFVMTAEGLPTGVTASFSPAPVIGTATTLTLAATAATATGTYNIVVKATAGSDFGTFTVPLIVGTATSALRQ
jgi:hypothetical protein